MALFLHQKNCLIINYYFFWKEGGKKLAEKYEVPFLGEGTNHSEQFENSG